MDQINTHVLRLNAPRIVSGLFHIPRQSQVALKTPCHCLPVTLEQQTLARHTQNLISTTDKMAYLATSVHGAPATGVENATRTPEFEHDKGEKSMPNKVKEKDIRDALAKRLRGEIEWLTPSGSIDVFTPTEVIVVNLSTGKVESDRSYPMVRTTLRTSNAFIYLRTGGHESAEVF